MSDVCPSCKSDLRGEPIPEANQRMFGGKTHFSQRIGQEIRGVYDGVLIWHCPMCDYAWPRFSEGKLNRIAKDIINGWEAENE